MIRTIEYIEAQDSEVPDMTQEEWDGIDAQAQADEEVWNEERYAEFIDWHSSNESDWRVAV